MLWLMGCGSFFIMVSCVIHGYYVYKEVCSPNIEDFVCFAAEENVYNRNGVTCSKRYPVISMSNDITGLITVVRYILFFEVYYVTPW